MMHTDNIYQEVLLSPPSAEDSLDTLFIVAGYASAAMANFHLRKQDTVDDNTARQISIRLIYGMANHDGIHTANHNQFCQMTQEFAGRFCCSYIYRGAPVHSKVYIWCEGDRPKHAFLGSANYTQPAMFGTRRREAMMSCPAHVALQYYQSLVADTIYCDHPDVEDMICVYKGQQRKSVAQGEGVSESAEPYAGLESVTTSFLARNGALPQRSGLNWGQRPEAHREPNQAYIPLRAEVYSSSFFPPVQMHFTVLTDDGKVFVGTRAQQQGKAIHTPHNNSLLGEYFRHRLGVGHGAAVQLADLQRYGRSDIAFYKVDDETYYMDFSIR